MLTTTYTEPPPSCMFDPTSDTEVLATRCCYCCVLRRTDSLVSSAAVRSLGERKKQSTKINRFIFQYTIFIMRRGPGCPRENARAVSWAGWTSSSS